MHIANSIRMSYVVFDENAGLVCEDYFFFLSFLLHYGPVGTFRGRGLVCSVYIVPLMDSLYHVGVVLLRHGLQLLRLVAIGKIFSG
jgi:hypothetical protein